MFIVLFHALYLFGKFVYTRYTSSQQTESEDIVDTECVHEDQSIESTKSFRGRNREIESSTLAQPPGDNSDDEKDMESNIKFYPPAYIQRYVAVQKVLEDARYKGKIRKVVDFGCAELGFVIYLKNTPGVEEILCVDIDKELLEWYQNKASPLHVDYLNTRDKPLTISIIEGSVTHNDKLLEKTDAVICIELIEHLYPDTLTDLPYNIFGFVKPQVAVMTTPNVEFNVLFKKPHGFRHHDHKFEWTREQFRDWADNIVARFPEYEVSISGICEGPAGSLEKFGCVSQMAVFHRRTLPNEYTFAGVEGLFKIITAHEYPFHVDNRSDEQKILDDTVYYIRNYSMFRLEYCEEVPLKKIMEPLKKYSVSIEYIRELLEQNGWNIANREEGPVVLVPERSESDSNSENNWHDLEYSWNDHDTVEDSWDLDPGPPSHYTSEQLVEMAISRENWDDEPSIPVQEEQEAPKEIHNSSSESIKPTFSEDIIERVEKVENIEDGEIKIQDTSNSSLQFKSSLNTSKNSSPLTFDFKEVLNHTTNLPSQRLLASDYKCEPLKIRSEKISSTENLTRKTYRKSQKKALESSNPILEELGSLCSMYLESSSNDNSKTCFQDLSNRSFESTLSATSSINNSKLDQDLSLTNEESFSFKKPRIDDRFSIGTLNSSLEKSQEMDTELKRKCKKDETLRNGGEILSESDLWEGLQTPESVSKMDLSGSSSQSSLPNFNISISTSSLEKSFSSDVSLRYKSTPITSKDGSDTTYKLHDKNIADSDTANTDVDVTLNAPDTVHIKTSLDSPDDSEESFKANEEFNAKKLFASNAINSEGGNLENINSKSPVNDAKEVKNSNSTEAIECVDDRELIQKSDTSLDEMEMIRDCSEFEKIFSKSQGSFIFEDSYVPKALDLSEISEMNLASSVILDTPPDSSSPEVMDSGYPNSASAHDMTPEYDVPSIEQDRISDSDSPSIEQDRISDSESPSIEEAPRPGFLELEIENGDLANNNRDDEGNNMIAAEDNEDDDLQPFINVLEIDIENENGIYVLQNGFPAWLLRILQMQEIGIAGNIPRFGLLDPAIEGAANVNLNEDFGSSSEED